MFWKTTALIAAGVLAMGAAQKPAAPKAAAPKPAASKSAPRASTPAAPAAGAAPRPLVAPVADFDARNPASVMAVLNTGGGKASVIQKDADTVLLSFVSIAANFSLQFEACDAQGRACKAIEFDSLFDQPGPTF